MEHKEIKLNKQTIYSTKTGIKYVQMLMPENWSITINTDKDRYGGYSYPYTFRITLKSEDKSVVFNYFSPRNYVDDHLKQFSNSQIDDYGNLLNRFQTIDEYLENWANNDLKNYSNVKCIETIVPDNMAKLEQDRKAKSLQENKSKGYILENYYYKQLVKAYSFIYNNAEWVRVYAGINEAESVGQYRTMEIGGIYSLDPFVRQMVLAGRNKNIMDGSVTYPIIEETRWNVRQLFTMDCRLEDYEFAYKNIFAPIRGQGVVICNDIWKDYEETRKKNSAEYENIRADKKEAVRIKREADEQKRKSDRGLYDYVRKTQQETHDIINSSYENQRKSQNKVREMWGDVNHGNTRFVDKDGREHVIHTYDNYAYKSGDHYLTSNSPLDHPYDWEELEKKKY